MYARIKTLGYEIELTNTAKDYITEKGFDPDFGARPLKRAIQKYLEDPMAEAIIKSSLKQGDILSVDYDKEKDEIVIKPKKSSNSKNKKLKEKESE